MARHYYLTRSGTLRRKDHTLVFEPVSEEETPPSELPDRYALDFVISSDSEAFASIDLSSTSALEMGDLSLEPQEHAEFPEIANLSVAEEPENETPVRVRDRRVIPVEDVDALWVFRELNLNARVLVFLGQKKIPVHLFNYYGFYAGSYYPREFCG